MQIGNVSAGARDLALQPSETTDDLAKLARVVLEDCSDRPQIQQRGIGLGGYARLSHCRELPSR
jgi:hypothetical protein